MNSFPDCNVRDMADTLASRLDTCYAVLDNLDYLCRECRPEQLYDMDLHDDLILLVTENITSVIKQLRTLSNNGGSSES